MIEKEEPVATRFGAQEALLLNHYTKMFKMVLGSSRITFKCWLCYRGLGKVLNISLPSLLIFKMRSNSANVKPMGSYTN